MGATATNWTVAMSVFSVPHPPGGTPATFCVPCFTALHTSNGICSKPRMDSKRTVVGGHGCVHACECVSGTPGRVHVYRGQASQYAGVCHACMGVAELHLDWSARNYQDYRCKSKRTRSTGRHTSDKQQATRQQHRQTWNPLHANRPGNKGRLRERMG